MLFWKIEIVNNILEVALFYQARDAVRRASIRLTGGSTLDLSKEPEVSQM
jgi:hypothetical protein